MECIWRLFCYWRPHGNRYQPHQAVFYLCFTIDDGLSYYPLYGAGFLEKYAQVHFGGKKESMVLFVNG